MEDVGQKYFLELLRWNFFQDVEEDELTNVISFKMHDLIHDLAQRVAGDETLGGSIVPFANRVVHVNARPNDELIEDHPSLLHAKRLRSLLLNDGTKVSLEKVVLGFRSLRVLEVSGIEVIPDSIRRMIHLRYLNFSNSCFRYLPGGITLLDNLQTLKLNYCHHLKELPRGFTKLTNLRHLGLRDCPLTEMRQNFGRMKSLREMNRFIIGQNNGLDALADLNLRGELEIVYWTWRTNVVLEAKRENLTEKTQLTLFSLCFEYQGEVIPVATRDDELLLESLQLPTSLKHLYFSRLRGNCFFRWMLKELLKLVEIRIHQCDSCRALPLFSHLPLLKRLSLKDLPEVEYVEESAGVSGSSTYFPALECLELANMPKLKSWVKLEDENILQLRHSYVLPQLRSLKISHGDKLTTLPSMPNLKSLTVSKIEEQLLESITSNQTASPSSSSTPTLKHLGMEHMKLTSVKCLIKKLRIIDCGSLRNMPIQSFSVLEELHIREYEDLDSIWEDDGGDGKGEIRLNPWEGFKTLHTLTLHDMPKVELLLDWITCLTTLQNLGIIKFENLTELPHNIGNLSSLRFLSIFWCPKLTTLPQSFSALTCLQTLWIYGCPKLEKLCEGPDGQDWPLIQHIPYVRYPPGSG